MSMLFYVFILSIYLFIFWPIGGGQTLYTSTTYVRREENHPFCP